jgi:deoxyribose-phosphate aldolase
MEDAMQNEWTKATLAKTIDHTLLKAIATADQVRELCAEARKFGFASVCVNPCWVTLCAKELAGSDVLVCTVIGFPLGANLPETKASEARLAVSQGAREVDMVINIGAAKSGDWKAVEEDVRGVVAASREAAGGAETLVKVIIETCYLTDSEKAKACEAAARAGARFVKTSTGFGTGGATVDDVRLMRKTVGDRLKVKASGGIRSYHDAILLLDAGADRIGASSSIAIVSELPE